MFTLTVGRLFSALLFMRKSKCSVLYFVMCYDKHLEHNSSTHSCRSQWPRSLRRRTSAARLLRLWVRIPPVAWMFVCCECCVLSGRGLWDGLITRPEESYRLWRVVVCDQETSNMRRLSPLPACENTTTMGCNARKTNNSSIYSERE